MKKYVNDKTFDRILPLAKYCGLKKNIKGNDNRYTIDIISDLIFMDRVMANENSDDGLH
jgi:hypothetical protein